MLQQHSTRHLTNILRRQAPLMATVSAVSVGERNHYSTTIPKETTAIVYDRHGGYDNVLRKSTLPLPTQLGGKQVLVKMLAAPINLADVSTIEGHDGKVEQNMPKIGGNEGVGQIVEAGHSVSLAKNQWVVPSRAGLGTWREYMIVNESDLLPVSNVIPVEHAATIAVNPGTAFRLLNDFVDLREGDVIVQNGASSMVGTVVIQLAKQRGIKTINIIRERPDHKETIAALMKLGGDIVVTEKDANSKETRQRISELPKAKLALNGVGGENTRQVASLLGKGGVMVTYGGMSRKPIALPTSPFIFSDITCRGFWMERWCDKHRREEQSAMIEELVDKIQSNNLTFFTETHKFANFEKALQAAAGPAVNQKKKVVVKFE